MEIIIALVVVILGAAVYFNRKKPEAPDAVDTWTPPKELHLTEQPAPVVEAVVAAPVAVKKPAAKKPAAKKAAPAKKPAVKKATPAKKTTVKKPAVKK